MRPDNQHVSDDYDGRCVDCGDDGNHQPSIFSDDRASLAHRGYMRLLASVEGLAAVVSLTAPLVGLTRIFGRSYAGPAYSDGVYLVDDDDECTGENTLSEGERMTIFLEPRPDIEKAPTLLVRHVKDAYGDTTNLEYTVSSYVAYSKVCIHTGYMVSGEDGAAFVCSYYFDKFDPTAGARMVGGLPSKALPWLPITSSNEGSLTATGDFNGPAGPGGE